MEFVNIPTEKTLNKSNQDYDIELWWYGFKNLLTNYFSFIEINNMSINKSINDLSEELNNLQKEKKYLDIYTKIYDFVILFFTNFVNNKSPITKYNYELLITWLKRYNTIDYIKKIIIPTTYTGKSLKEIPERENIILKFYIKYYEMEYSLESDLVSMYNENFNDFMDFCIDYELNKIVNMFSSTYNLQEFYDYKGLKKKFVPIKGIKFINLF